MDRMKRKRKSRIEISNSDLKLFRYLHFFRGALVDQIARDILQHLRTDTIYWRLKKLERFDYLHGKFTKFHANKKARGITTKAFKEFMANGDEQMVEVSSKSVDHDIELIDICSALCSLQKVKCYISENELNTWNAYSKAFQVEAAIKLRSDACIKIQLDNDEFWLPLEYESNAKSIKRYEDHLYQIYSRPDLVAIFYVCKNIHVQNAIQRVEESKYKNERPRIYYILLDELKQKQSIAFTSRLGKVLELGNKTDAQFTSKIKLEDRGALFSNEVH